MANYVEGLPELKAAMQAVPRKIMVKAVRKAITRGAQVVVVEARRRAPVRSGILRKYITKKMSKIRNDRITALIGVETGKAQLTDTGKHVAFKTRGKVKVRRATKRELAGHDPYYYRFQEVGFTAVGTRRGGTGRWIEGKHYLSGALDAKQAQIVSDFESIVRTEVEKYQP